MSAGSPMLSSRILRRLPNFFCLCKVKMAFKKEDHDNLAAKGYDIEKLKAFKLEKSIVEDYYFETGIYKITNAGLKTIMSDERMKAFNKINPNSKELIYFNIKYENKIIILGKNNTTDPTPAIAPSAIAEASSVSPKNDRVPSINKAKKASIQSIGILPTSKVNWNKPHIKNRKIGRKIGSGLSMTHIPCLGN